jgi:hypothetical protein
MIDFEQVFLQLFFLSGSIVILLSVLLAILVLGAMGFSMIYSVFKNSKAFKDGDRNS